MGMLGEATDISMAKMIEPRMSLGLKKELVKIIISTPIPSRKKCRMVEKSPWLSTDSLNI
jgi:hypothetical protein